MPKKKRGRPSKQSEPAPTPTAKAVFEVARSRRKWRKPRKMAEPVPVVAEAKSVMHRILESQREQLNQLRDDLQKVIFLGW